MLSLRRALLPTCAAASFAFVSAAFGQMFAIGQTLPRTAFQVCGTLEATQRMASASYRFGTEEYSDRNSGYYVAKVRKIDGCLWLAAEFRIERREDSISPFETWTPVYSSDPSAERYSKPNSSDVIGYRIARQTVRYYQTTYLARDGNRYLVYAEIPDEPFDLAYLRAMGRW